MPASFAVVDSASVEDAPASMLASTSRLPDARRTVDLPTLGIQRLVYAHENSVDFSRACSETVLELTTRVSPASWSRSFRQ